MARPRLKPEPQLLPETKRLALLIEELGISRREFARRLGMSPSGLGALFQRAATVSVVMAKAVECEFGVRHQWLLSGQGTKWYNAREGLRPSERWLLKMLSRQDRFSLVVQVELPLNLAVSFFQQELLRLQQELVAQQLGRHIVMKELYDWQQNIALWLRGDWRDLRQEVSQNSDMSTEVNSAAPGLEEQSSPRQWQTARYYYMDITVMEETKRPSLEAVEFGIELDRAWIDDRRQQLHERWYALSDMVQKCLKEDESGWLSME